MKSAEPCATVTTVIGELVTCARSVADRSIPPDTVSSLDLVSRTSRRGIRIARTVTNVALGRHVVGRLWPHELLVAELDSRAFHADPVAFESDRARHADLQVAATASCNGVTDRRMRMEPAALASVLRYPLRRPP